MESSTFVQVTLCDFMQMEARGWGNKARVLHHEGDKLLRGEQALLPTIRVMLDIVSDPMENYYKFPPPGTFHIERGH